MGILTQLCFCSFSVANSQVPLKRSARGTEDRQLGTELCLLLGPTVVLAACLPPRPFSVLQPLAFWHSTFTHTGKIGNYYKPSMFHVVLKEKGKKPQTTKQKPNIKRMPDMRPTELMPKQLSFQREFYVPQLFRLSSFPLHQTRPAPGHMLQMELDHSGVGSHLQAASWGRHSVCATGFETDLWSKPNIVNAGAALGEICITFGFNVVQPLP